MNKNIYLKILQIAILLTISFDLLAQKAIVTESTLSRMVAPQRVDKFSIIDSANFQVTYETEIVNDVTKRTEKQNDIQVLLIGKHISKFYSRLIFESDSLCSAFIKRDQNFSPSFKEDVPPVEVYKNYPENKITATYRTFCFGPTYLYVEDNILFDWIIHPDRKKILIYNCQKVTTIFRGREYEAWFTMDIPIKEGPYKFAGLPGLILQIQDTKGDYKYTCIGFQKVVKKVPIKKWSWKYETTTREKLNELLKRIYKNPTEFVISNGFQVFKTDKIGNLNPINKNESYPYNPIELK